MSVVDTLVREAASQRELWRYVNAPKLARLDLPEGQGGWRTPTVTPKNINHEWIVDGDTATLRVPENSHLAIETIHELAHGQEAIRLVIQVGAGATLTAQLGLQVGGNAMQRLEAIINLAEGATFNHLRLPQVADDGYLFTQTTVDCAAAAHYTYFCLADCGAQTRHQLQVNLNGKAASATLGGIYKLDGTQVAEHTLVITHNAADTQSQQLFRGTADASSRGVFQGKIVVAKGADRTDAQQTHKALLLSPRAEIDAKPELEIHADEVKCSHGASVGALDAGALFYLRSRGIGADEARTLLTQAFLAEALTVVEAASPKFAATILARLGHAGA